MTLKTPFLGDNPSQGQHYNGNFMRAQQFQPPYLDSYAQNHNFFDRGRQRNRTIRPDDQHKFFEQPITFM